METTELPADVQAALAAYLAARVDDVTWTAYIDGLGPGLALDVATDLCVWTVQDADALAWVTRHFEADPEDASWNPPGVVPYSCGMTEFLQGGNGLVQPTMTLDTAYEAEVRYRPRAWTVTLEGEEWESTGCVTAAEARQWGYARPYLTPYWAVAACRATCHAWSPGWMREQAADA